MATFKMSACDDKLKERINAAIRKEESDRKPSVPTPVVECNPGHESVAKKEAPGFHGPVHISIHVKRHTLLDSDNTSPKYLIDALVECGVLQDDGPGEIPDQIVITQEKIPSDQTESTTIIIEEY